MLILLVIAFFRRCCNQFFFSAVMWGLRFPFFWSCVCHYMRFTTLRTKNEAGEHVQLICSSMPDLLTMYFYLEDPQD